MIDLVEAASWRTDVATPRIARVGERLPVKTLGPSAEDYVVEATSNPGADEATVVFSGWTLAPSERPEQVLMLAFSDAGRERMMTRVEVTSSHSGVTRRTSFDVDCRDVPDWHVHLWPVAAEPAPGGEVVIRATHVARRSHHPARGLILGRLARSVGGR